MPAGVEILLLSDCGQWSIGRKRQYLLEQSRAEWVSFFDDDDLPSLDYCRRIMEAIGGKDAPDVMGFRLRYYEDGTLCGSAIHSYRAAEIATPPEIPAWCHRQERLPNHLNPVRRAMALKAGFPDLNHGEDAEYARRLAALNPREAFIDAFLYEYHFRSDRSGERTNAILTGQA